MPKILDAVILAGGKGTRMLPSNQYAPKEVLPLVDTPILNHLIWEAMCAGVERIHIVVSKSKRDIISNVVTGKKNREYEQIREDIPRESIFMPPKNTGIIIHEQNNQGGVGEAIYTALNDIKGPFIVLLGDNIIISEHLNLTKMQPNNGSKASKKLVDYYNRTGLPCAGLIKVNRNELEKYGVVSLEKENIKQIVEKPTDEEAPSNYVLCGRYLLPDNTKELLNKFGTEEYGELQSIAVLEHLIKNGGLGGVKLDGYELYDSGDPLSWLKSQISHALKRDDLSKNLTEWLKKRF